jgi:hypothetical protein
MNETSYLRAKIDNPNFDEEYVIEIDIYDILTDEHEKNNEVRMQGLNPTMFKQTKHEIKQHGTNYVPIDVDPLPGDRWKPHDGGGNRYRAIRELYEETGDERFRHIRAIKRSYSSNSGRAISMLNANLPMFSSTEATHDDIVHTLHRCITEHYYFGTDYSKIDVDDVTRMIKDNLERKLHGNTINAIAKKINNKLPHASSKYYRPVDDKETVESFNQINPYGMTLPVSQFKKNGNYSWGTIVEDKDGQEWAVYCAKQLTWTKQNVVHYAVFKKQANPDVKIMIICYNGNVRTTKSGECPVKNFRQNAHNNLMKIARGVAIIDPENNNKLLSDTLIDRDVYLPQIVKGALKDDMSYLYDFQGNKIE